MSKSHSVNNQESPRDEIERRFRLHIAPVILDADGRTNGREATTIVTAPLEELVALFESRLALAQQEAADKQLAWIEKWVGRTPKSEWTTRIHEAIRERRSELSANQERKTS